MKVVILDGRDDRESGPVLDVLLNELQSRGADVMTIRLRDLKMGSCIGCFRCWLKTPGVCVEADEGREFAHAVVQSDTTILLSPVTFGGYSSEIKKAQDRWLPIVLPDFGVFHGEIHHKPRYARYPRLVGIGIQDLPNVEEAHVFRVLVGRNALNFHSPSFAADVVLASDSEAALRQQVSDTLEREDAFPLGKTITSLLSQAVAADDQGLAVPNRPQRALLIVGSPKTRSSSTSAVLGNTVLKQLEEHGWETTSLTLRRSLLGDKGKAELLAAAGYADLILLAFPLYIDSVPFLMMKALELMAKQLGSSTGGTPKGVVAVVNNGFPEAYNNAPAVAICRRFAIAAGMTWRGGLALGAGEALVHGQGFETKRKGPPVAHVKRALDLAAAALAEGQPVPEEAIKLIRKTPIPLVPFRLWRWFFIKVANRFWRQGAARNQVDSEAMLARPYADAAPPRAQ